MQQPASALLAALWVSGVNQLALLPGELSPQLEANPFVEEHEEFNGFMETGEGKGECGANTQGCEEKLELLMAKLPQGHEESPGVRRDRV